MKKTLSIVASGAVVGVVIGTTLELLFSSLHGPSYTPGVPSFLEGFANENAAVAIQRVIYAAYGVALSLASQVYCQERLSLTLASLIHLTLTLGGGLAVGAYLHWFSPGQNLGGYLALFIGVYAVIWVVTWLVYRSRIAKINQALSVI